MSSEQRNYDGQLVIMLDDDVLNEEFWAKSHEERNVLFRTEETGEFITVDLPILYHLGLKTFFQKRLRAKGEALQPYDEGINELMDIAKALGVSKIYDTILQGRLQMALLLNTRGGIGTLRKTFQGLVDHVHSKNGEVSAYGKDLVASLGALLFMEGDPDQRFILSTCSLFFHVSTACYGNDEFARWQIRADWEMLKKLITEKSRPEKREELEKIFANVLQKGALDRPIEFSGRQASNFGLAQDEDDIVTLQKGFDERYGLDHKSYEDSRIEAFFSRKKSGGKCLFHTQK